MATATFRKDILSEKPFSLWVKIYSPFLSFLGIEHKPSSCKKVVKNGAGRAQKTVANSVASNGKASNAFVCSEASRIVMAKMREARKSGKGLKFKGANNHLLQKCLDNTPLDLCHDKEWENMRDVGKEIVD